MCSIISGNSGGRDTFLFLGWDGPSSSVWQWPVERMRPNRSCHSICDPHPCSIAPLLPSLEEQNWSAEKWATGKVLTNWNYVVSEQNWGPQKVPMFPHAHARTFFWALGFIRRIEWHFEINLSSWNHPRLINMTHMEKGRVHKKTKSLTFCYLALNPPPPVHIWAKWKYSSNTLRLKWFLWSWKKIGKSKHLSFLSSSKINKGQNLLFNLSLCKRDLQ